jgi:GTPase SAR1 family protein
VEKHSGDDVNIMVLANKSDLDEEVVVTEAEIAQFEKEKGISIIRTSAKSGSGVDDCFLDMTKKLIVKKS